MPVTEHVTVPRAKRAHLISEIPISQLMDFSGGSRVSFLQTQLFPVCQTLAAKGLKAFDGFK